MTTYLPASSPAPRVLAEMIEALQALRETVANACELHAREFAVIESDETSALVSWINDLFCSQNDQLEILREKLGRPRGLPPRTEAGSSVQIADLYTRLRQEERSLILRDLSTLLNLAVNECAMLHSAALALKERDLAHAAVAQLGEIIPVLVEIARLLPAATIADLACRCTTADPLAATLAHDEIQKASHPAFESVEVTHFAR